VGAPVAPGANVCALVAALDELRDARDDKNIQVSWKPLFR